MNTRLTVPLDLSEREALYAAAKTDMRPLRDQARWLIRQGLELSGYLPASDGQKGEPAQESK